MPSVNVAGVGVVNFPDTMSQGDIINAIERDILPSIKKPEPPSKERTFGESIQDIGAGVVSGVGALTQLPGQLYGLATGDFEKSGLLGAGQDIQKYAQTLKSPGLLAMEQERAQKIQEAEKEGQLSAFKTAFSETISNPALLTNFLAEQAPNLIPALGAARIASAAAGARAGVTAAVRTGAVQQGADIGAQAYEEVYNELRKSGIPEEEASGRALGYARATGAGAAVISLLAQRLPGAKALEESLAGVQGTGGRAFGALRGALGETAGEITEETGGRLAQNLAMLQVNPEYDLTTGLGQTAGMAAVGGVGMGGISGALQRPAAPSEVPPTTPPSAFAATGEEPEGPAPIPGVPALEAPEIGRDIISAPPVSPPVFEEAAPDRLMIENRSTIPEEFIPRVFPDGSIAMTSEDVNRWEEEQFQQKYAPQDIEKPAVEEIAPVEPPTKADLTYATATQEIEALKKQKRTDEITNRINELQNNKLEIVMDQMRRANEPIRPELMELRKQIEAGVMTEEGKNKAIDQAFKEFKEKTKGLEKAKPLKDEVQIEIESLKKEANKISRQIAGMQTGRKKSQGASLKTELTGKLKPSDVLDIGPDKANKYLVAKSSSAENSLSDLVADGKLDQWLPTDMRPESATFDEQDSTEYIKEKLRAEDFKEFDVGQNIQQLSEGLNQITSRIDELSAPSKVTEAVAELPIEEARQQAAAGAAEAGFVGAPEESIEIKGELQSKMEPSNGALPSGQTAQHFVINKNAEEERIEKELTGKSILEVAKWSVDNAPNKFAKIVAQKVLNRLNGMAKRGIKMEFEIASGPSRPSGMRNSAGTLSFNYGQPGKNIPASIKLVLNGAAVMDNQGGYPPGVNYSTILHELLHAATTGQLRVLSSSDPLVKELRDLFNTVVKHFNTEHRAGRVTPFMHRAYRRAINPLNDPDEMLAWGLTDTDMQLFLDSIKIDNQTAFTKLAEIIRKILNITTPYKTALDELIRTTESILDEDINVVAGKIIARQYSFGTAPKEATAPAGEAIQGTLFQKKGKEEEGEVEEGTPRFAKARKFAEEAAKKAAGQRTPPETAFEGVPEDLMAKIRPSFYPDKKTIIDKVEANKDRFFQRMAQGIADQYRTIKDYSSEAYMMARLSKTIDGALEGLMFNGQVKLTDGALDIKADTKGLIQALEPVGTEVDRYQIWVALSRDADLVRNGKISSFNKELVQRRNELAKGTLNGKSRLEIYEGVRKDMNALNKSVLDIAFKQGLIDKEAYARFASDINYIPFYKEMEDGNIQGAATASGLANQHFSKELKGGEKPFGDLMENTLRNWSAILSASMKNAAAVKTVEAAVDMGAAFPNLKAGLEWKDGKVYSTKSGEMVDDGSLKPGYTTSGKGMAKVMMDGNVAYFEITDPLLLDAIMSIGYMGPKSKFLDVARDFKNILQLGVTVSPAFKVRNLFRDSISAMAVSDMKLNPFANIARGWAMSNKNNPAHISALAGGAIFNFGSAYEGDQSKLIKRLLKMGVDGNNILDTEDKIKAGLGKAWQAYQEFGNKSESANRMALYQQMRDKGMSHLEASFYARDLLDFSMQGSFPAFRMVTQVVPFLNARVQGLYKLGRDGIVPTSRVIYNTVTGKPIEATDAQKAQQFSTVTGAVVLASLALYMAFKDDEEFKKREQWDRDNFWWFRLPGMEAAIRVPKPFEIGAFGTMAERTLEQIIDSGAEGKIFEQSFKRMMSDTFALNPTPQMIKPLVDLYANKDSFTGAPIETAGMERLSKAERYSEATSPLAKALSQVSNVFLPEAAEMSPVQADYAIKAYFGWLGGTIAATSHYAVMPFSKGAYPDHNWAETASLGFVKSLPTTQSQYVTAFYENNKQISEAYADMRHYAELGQAEKVQEIIEEKGDKIAMAKFYDKTAKDMSKIRKAIQTISRDETMSGSEKKEEIDRLKLIIGDLAEQAETARKSMRK